MKKTCTKCGIEKGVGEFHKHPRTKDKLTPQCKICQSRYRKEYHKKNKEKSKEYYQKDKEKNKEKQKEYYQKNKEKIKEKQKECYQKNKEKQKEYYQKNKEKFKEYHQKNKENFKEYRQKNKEKVNEKSREYVKLRREKDVAFKILTNLRSRVYLAIKDNSKSTSTLKLLGCTIPYVKTHLENQFLEGMTWDNYGLYGWHIDHIKPCASFDLTDPEQQKECFHYTNLQPLWAKDNLEKSDKISVEYVNI